MVETNKITELYDGHFQLILDSPDKLALYKIIDPSYRYVWMFEHQENKVEWGDYKHSLFGVFDDTSRIRARNMKMESLVPTDIFLKLIPSISQTIKIIQTNTAPPYFLNLENIHGKTRYNLLKKHLDYLFELDMPGASDYTPIISPNKAFLETIRAAFA
jgi:hypothetical protein